MIRMIAIGIAACALSLEAAAPPAQSAGGSGAAAPAGFGHWTAAEIRERGGRLATNTGAREVAGDLLGRYGNHTVMVLRRDGTGDAEWHERIADLFIVHSGRATLHVGGTMVGERAAGAGERRAPSISGGVTRVLAEGDIVHIPPGTPHQVLIAPGERIVYTIVKVVADAAKGSR